MIDKEQQELLQSVQQIMHDFKEGGRFRDKEGLRLARRTAQIIRWSSVGMVMLGLAMLALLYVLTKDLVLITNNIVAMSSYTKSMSEDMGTMKTTMLEIRKEIGAMSQTTAQLSVETRLMRINIEKINTSIAVLPDMSRNVQMMSQDFKVINSQIGHIGGLMGSMTRDTHDMSQPMRMMPWN